MKLDISIRTSEDLCKNYSQISALTKQNPVAITVSGKEDTVLISYEDFQDQIHYISEMEAKVNAYSHLAKATEDIKSGRVQSAELAFAEIFDGLVNGDRKSE